MTTADTAAILHALTQRASAHVWQLREAVWRATGHWYDDAAVRTHVHDLIAIGWVERHGAWFRLTDTGHQIHAEHVARAPRRRSA